MPRETRRRLRPAHLAVARIEQAVEDYLAGIALPQPLVKQTGSELDELLADELANSKELDANLRKELRALDLAGERLVIAVEDGTLPHDAVRERLTTIQRKRASITERLDDTTATLTAGVDALRKAFTLCQTASDLYERAGDTSRTLILQARFHTIYVDEHAEVTDAVPTRIVADIVNTRTGTKGIAESAARNPVHWTGVLADPRSRTCFTVLRKVTGSSKRVLVELRGFRHRSYLAAPPRITASNQMQKDRAKSVPGLHASGGPP